jgi:hypothetical protein
MYGGHYMDVKELQQEESGRNLQKKKLRSFLFSRYIIFGRTNKEG